MKRKWFLKYILIPYEKMNCSQFVSYVLKDRFEREYNFPQSQGSFFKESQQLREEIPNYCRKSLPEEEPEDGDLVLMHGRREMCHVGLFVRDGRKSCVLHSERSKGCSMLHEFRDLPGYGFYVEGVYKWLK